MADWVKADNSKIPDPAKISYAQMFQIEMSKINENGMRVSLFSSFSFE